MPDACRHAYLIARVAVCRACGDTHVLREGRDLTPNAALLARLTPRQREAVALAVEGYDHHDIAREMGVTYNTALHFIRSAYLRCGAHARTELVLMYFGLLPLGGSDDLPATERAIEQAPAWQTERRWPR